MIEMARSLPVHPVKSDLVQAIGSQLNGGPRWSCGAPSGQLALAQWHATDVSLVHPDSDFCTLVFHLEGSTRVAGFSGVNCIGQGVQQSSITIVGPQSSSWVLEGAVSFVHLYIPRAALDQHVQKTRGIARAPWLQPCFGRIDPWLKSMFSLLVQDRLINGTAQAPLLDSLCGPLMDHLLRHYTHGSLPSHRVRRETSLGNTALRKIEAYIDAHLSEVIRLDHLARLAEVSEGHLSRAFRRATGVTPHQFLITRRLERARHLLQDLELPVAEVAMRVGFGSASHLGEAFRKRWGLSPGQYRAVHFRSVS